jgi:hypothetical protein
MSFQDKILVVIDATSGAAVKEMDRLQKASKGADLSVKDMGRTLKTGLVAGAAAFVGAGLVSALNQTVTAFQEAQTSAAQFARATNASVQEAGKFTMVAKAAGLGMNDLVEINAEFSRKIREQPQLLQQLNVQIAKNADGSVNMTRTLVSTLDALGAMEDGLKAAQIAAQLFGEEGSKQLAGFYLAGIKVSDLMERIDFVDKSDDAKAYAASTMELNLAFQQLQIEVGSRLVPVLTTLVDAGMALGSFLGGIPTSVYLAVGAFVAINKALAFFRSELAATILIGFIDNVIAPMGAGFVGVEGAAAKAGVAIRGVGLALKTAMSAALPLLALMAAIEVVMNALSASERTSATVLGIKDTNASLMDQAKILRDTDSVIDSILARQFDPFLPGWLKDNYDMERVTDSYRSQAEATLAAADATNTQKKAAQDLLDVINAGNLATDEGTEAMALYRAAMGGAAAVSAQLQTTQKNLADAIADIVLNGADAKTTWADIAAAAQDAATAQANAKKQAELYDAAMGMVSKTIQGTVDWQKRLLGIPKSIEEAKNAIQSSWQSLETADDGSQYWKRITDNIQTAGDEGKIAIADFGLAVQDYIASLAAAGTTPLEIRTNLEELKATLPPDLAAVVDAAIANVSGKQNEIPLDLTFDAAAVDAKVAALREQLKTALAAGDYGLAN